jgi:hypothetical protein
MPDAAAILGACIRRRSCGMKRQGARLAARESRTFRLLPERAAELDAIASARFGGNRTAALDAAIAIAATVYGSPAGRAGEDPADALERWCAARRRPGAA